MEKMEIALLLPITAHTALSLYEVQFYAHVVVDDDDTSFFLLLQPCWDLFSIEQRRSMQNRSHHHRWKKTKKYWKVRWVENWCEGLRWFFFVSRGDLWHRKEALPNENLFSLERTHIVHHCEIDYNETRLK